MQAPDFIVLENVISSDDLDSFIQEISDAPTNPAQLSHWDGTVGIDTSIRRTDIHDLPKDHWINQAVFKQVQTLNESSWGFELFKPEDSRVLNYAPGGHYVWHSDVLPSSHANQYCPNSNRMLTAIINLSDESEYSMGDLLVEDPVSGPRSPGFHGRGTMIVFPSHLEHRATAITAGFRRVLVTWIRGKMDAPANQFVVNFLHQQENPSAEPNIESAPIAVPIKDSLVVYQPFATSVNILNEFSSLLWQASCHQIDLTTLGTELANSLSVPKEVIARDIQAASEQWQASGISPTAQSRIEQPRTKATNGTSQMYYLGGCHIEIIFQESDIENQVRPLLKCAEVQIKTNPRHSIKLSSDGGFYLLQIDKGNPGLFTSIPRIVMSLFSEIQAISARSGGASMMLGAAALGIQNQAILFPGLLNPGRTVLVHTLARELGATILSGYCLPYFRANGMVEALPLPLKFRDTDQALIQQYNYQPEYFHGYGTETDRYSFLAADYPQQDMGKKYHPVLSVNASFNPEKETTLSKLSEPEALSQLMASGSYFTDDMQHIDILNLSSLVENMPSYQLSFDSLDNGLLAITNLIQQLKEEQTEAKESNEKGDLFHQA
jgi:hypothetical protein